MLIYQRVTHFGGLTPMMFSVRKTSWVERFEETFLFFSLIVEGFFLHAGHSVLRKARPWFRRWTRHWQTLRICSALVLSCAKCWLAGIHFTLPTWMMHSLFRPGILIVETLGAGVAKLNHATHSTIQRSSSSSSPPAPAPLLPAVFFSSLLPW